VGRVAATPGRAVLIPRTGAIRLYSALAIAGFRRYATYRQAIVAAMFANSVFGFLRCFVLLAAATSAGTAIGGYSAGQLMTFVWVGQGLIGTVLLWTPMDMGERIRSGQIAADLLRPVDPVWHQLAIDAGQAGYGVLTRFAFPLVVGALAFDLYVPHRPATYPLFVLSVVLATLVCFGCRYLVNVTSYWLLDSRGPQVAWLLVSTIGTGLYFPLWLLPDPYGTLVMVGTPFASILQAPLDIVVERVDTAGQLRLIAVQVVWAVFVIALARLVQRRAERRLVIQGG
jgi:ABC-2 type transport system permease protein